MLKREIKYTNYNDEETSDIFYFNLSKPELMEMEVQKAGGFANQLQNAIDAKDNKTLLKVFKEIVLLAYGQKSDDGKRFIKTDELREEFSQTAAYEALFTQLALDDGEATKFLLGVMPKDMVNEDTGVPVPPPAPSPPSS